METSLNFSKWVRLGCLLISGLEYVEVLLKLLNAASLCKHPNNDVTYMEFYCLKKLTFSKLYSNLLKRIDNEEQDSAFLISALKLYFKTSKLQISKDAVFNDGYELCFRRCYISTGRKKLAANPRQLVYSWTFSVNLPPFYPVSHRTAKQLIISR